MADSIYDILSRMPRQQQPPPQPPGVAARQMGLLAPQQSAPQPMQQPPGFRGGNLPQIYGLLAQHADNPSSVGNQYVQAVQQQQQLDMQNQPMERYLRLYGSVNPFDFTTNSLQKFHDNFTQTGELQFDLLERKEELSTAEQGFLNTAIQEAYKAESDLGRMSDIGDRYEQMAVRGVREGIAGRGEEWLKNILGGEDELSQLRTEYHQLKVSNIVQNLPPGVASDKDVEIVMKGWPDATADSWYIAAFLRGMMKLRAVDAAYHQHAAAYLGTHRTQTGQMQDWMARRPVLLRDIFNRFGGIYNPIDTTTGRPMSAEAAAQYYFNRFQVDPNAFNAPTTPTNMPTDNDLTLGDYSTDELLRMLDEQ